MNTMLKFIASIALVVIISGLVVSLGLIGSRDATIADHKRHINTLQRKIEQSEIELLRKDKDMLDKEEEIKVLSERIIALQDDLREAQRAKEEIRTLTVFELPISSSSRQQLVVPSPHETGCERARGHLATLYKLEINMDQCP